MAMSATRWTPWRRSGTSVSRESVRRLHLSWKACVFALPQLCPSSVADEPPEAIRKPLRDQAVSEVDPEFHIKSLGTVKVEHRSLHDAGEDAPFMNGITSTIPFRRLELRGSRQIRERGGERLRAGRCGSASRARRGERFMRNLLVIDLNRARIKLDPSRCPSDAEIVKTV